MKFRSPFEGPWATSHPPLDVKTGDWRSQRPVTRLDKCRQCGWCYIVCPSSCIEEEKGHFIPNLDYCKGCGICARNCPSKAIIIVREEV